MKAVGKLLILFILFMFFLITFGNRGIIDNYLTSKKLADLKNQTQAITSQNEALKRKIYLLKNDINYIEMIARNELGMVKKGDLIYRWSQ